MRSLRQLQDMSGRVAVITGGAGHVGQAATAVLRELGATTVSLDLPGRLATADVCLHTDLAEESAVVDAVGAILSRVGGVDVIVHAAALVGTSEGLRGWAVPFREQQAATWRLALDVNVSSLFTLVQEALPALQESHHGSVIAISSIYGVVGPRMDLYEGTALGNPAGYGVTKAGLIQLVRWLAAALAPSIRVNAISPGGILREQPELFQERYAARTPLARMATEEDLAGAIAFLASDLSSYVTGHNLVVDGGWTTL